LFEKIILIKSFIESTIISPQDAQPTFRLYLLQILKNFDSLTLFGNCKDFELVQIILEHSNRIYDNVFSLSTLLIGDHPKASISQELEQLFKILKQDIPNQIKEKKISFQHISSRQGQILHLFYFIFKASKIFQNYILILETWFDYWIIKLI
jgi:hypothetical protein